VLKLKLVALQHHALMFAILFAALALDLTSKAWAHAALEPHNRQNFIPHLLNFILVSNTGLAFSMVNENGLLAKIISSAVFLALFYFYCRRYLFKTLPHPALEQLGVSIIIGAAAGNLLERFIYGHVTDFLEFAFITFPIFNLADVMIDIGVGLVFISMYCSKKQK
jgi:signal peptidase II